jgi:hypothetical protein
MYANYTRIPLAIMAITCFDNSPKFFPGGARQQFSDATNGAVIERQFHRNELKAWGCRATTSLKEALARWNFRRVSPTLSQKLNLESVPRSILKSFSSIFAEQFSPPENNTRYTLFWNIQESREEVIKLFLPLECDFLSSPSTLHRIAQSSGTFSYPLRKRNEAKCHVIIKRLFISFRKRWCILRLRRDRIESISTCLIQYIIQNMKHETLYIVMDYDIFCIIED